MTVGRGVVIGDVYRHGSVVLAGWNVVTYYSIACFSLLHRERNVSRDTCDRCCPSPVCRRSGTCDAFLCVQLLLKPEAMTPWSQDSFFICLKKSLLSIPSQGERLQRSRCDTKRRSTRTSAQRSRPSEQKAQDAAAHDRSLGERKRTNDGLRVLRGPTRNAQHQIPATERSKESCCSRPV